MPLLVRMLIYSGEFKHILLQVSQQQSVHLSQKLWNFIVINVIVEENVNQRTYGQFNFQISLQKLNNTNYLLKER